MNDFQKERLNGIKKYIADGGSYIAQLDEPEHDITWLINRVERAKILEDALEHSLVWLEVTKNALSNPSYIRKAARDQFNKQTEALETYRSEG